MAQKYASIQRIGRGVSLIILLAIAAGCAKPTVAERMKQHREKVAETQRYIRGLDRYEDPELERYLNGVMQRLATASGIDPVPVSILDVSYANAFVSKRDGVRLTRGMLALISDEAELAAVLGHEIAHLTQPQRIEGWSSLMEGGSDAEDLPNRLTRVMQQREIAADRMAMQMAERAGYDSGAAHRVIRKLSALDRGKASDVYIRSHPLGDDRIAALGSPRPGDTAAKRYREAIDGLPFGGYGQRYFVSDGRVHAPFLKLSFPMPNGMKLTKQKRALATFKNTRADMTFYVTRIDSPETEPELALRREVYEMVDRKIGLGGLRDLRRLRSVTNGAAITARASIDYSDPSFTVRFVMIAHEGDWLSGVLFHPQRSKADASALIEGFAAGLTEEPATDRLRLRYVDFGPSQSLEELAREWGAGADGMRLFRAINDLATSEAPGRGRPIKTISRR